MTRTNSTTKAIVNFLNLNGHVAHRNNTAGVFDPVAKRFHTITPESKGVGDILCCLKGGIFLEVEVKTGKDKLSPEQIRRRERIVGVRGLYCEAHSYDEFRHFYDTVVTPRLKGIS